MDWKSYRNVRAVQSSGRYPHDDSEPIFEFLPEQGPGRRFNFVPGKMVVPAECEADVQGLLQQNGFTLDTEFGNLRVYSGTPLPQTEFIALIDEANALTGGDVDDTPIAPLHTLTIQDHGDFGPASTPAPAPALALSALAGVAGQRLPGEGVRVGVLDTGVYRAHPMFGEHLDSDSDEEEIEFDPVTGHLLRGVGHGTFVAGVVLRCAPGATIFARKVVTPHGVTDDIALARALEELGPKVHILCLPLGGYAMNDRGPRSIMTILDKLYADHPDLVVVSAAGNDSRSEPFYPAADPRVIGVGALDETGERAGYSNYGDWVDTYALGSGIHSAFVNWDKRAPAPGSGRGHTHDAELNALIEEMDRSVKDNEGPWAIWSGTSFATPVVVGAIAAKMRPAQGPDKSASKAAFAVAGDPRLKRQTSAGSLTEHTFVVQPVRSGAGNGG